MDIMIVARQYYLYSQMIFIYFNIWLLDMINYYFKYFMLHMPASIFGPPIIKFKQIQKSSSDVDSDEEESVITECEIFINQIVLVFESASGSMTTQILHGGQLRPFIDTYGKFLVGEFERYFKDLNTIYIQYAKDGYKSGDESQSLKKIIDVKKRYDSYNDKSCKLGVLF